MAALYDTDSPDTSDADSLDTSDTDTPDTSDADTPDTSDTDSLDTSDTDTPDTSDADTPDTSDTDTPDTDTFSHELPAVTTDTWKGELDFTRACSGPERRCWLCTELTPWNQVMHGLSFELVELRPGKLCLQSNPRGDGFIERDHATDASKASFLVSWLLQHHRCIDELKVAYRLYQGGFREKETHLPISLRPAAGSDIRRTLRGLEIEQSPRAWWDAYGGVSRDCFELVDLDAVGGLERLKLDFTHIKPKFAAELAKLLRRNASSIKRFEISDAMVPRQVSHALRYLYSCESLTISSLHGLCDGLPSVSSVARLMHSSTALKELTIASIGSRRHIFAIAKELQTNTSLTKLILHMAEWSCSPEAVFAALHVNTTLRELWVTKWRMSNECGQALASLLRKNTGLRVLHIGDVDISEFCLILLADAVTVNTTLESLHISSKRLLMNGISALCKALGSNKTLKKLLFRDFEFTDLGFAFMDLPEPRAVLARQLTEDDCYGRVQLPWTEHDLPGLTAALTSSFAGFEEFRLSDIHSLSVTGLKLLFDALASNECVHTLGVCVMEDPGEQGTALCEMLKVNRSIQCLDLAIDKDEYKFVEEMSHALAENTAITKIMLRFDSLREFETATALSYLLAHNKTASKFFLRSSSGFCDGFVGEFTQGMLQNKTIVKLGLGRNSFCNSVNFPLFEAVHRNRGALNRAVDFVVSPSLDRQCAEGFEWFSGRPCLLKYLKKVTGKTEPEVLLAIAAAERYLRDNYLLITGIVRHSVECHPAKGTQVDALNKDCWLAIVRHLTIADVLA